MRKILHVGVQESIRLPNAGEFLSVLNYSINQDSFRKKILVGFSDYTKKKNSPVPFCNVDVHVKIASQDFDKCEMELFSSRLERIDVPFPDNITLRLLQTEKGFLFEWNKTTDYHSYHEFEFLDDFGNFWCLKDQKV